MTKKDEEDFNDSTNCQICVNAYVDGDTKVRDIVISSENTESLPIEIVISKLN